MTSQLKTMPKDSIEWVCAAESRIEHLERDLAQAVAALEIIAAQHSGEVGGTSRSDCMAAIARASLGTIDLSLLDKKE